MIGRLAESIILLTGWRRTLLAILAGALAVLGQAPFDFPLACFIAFPILVWLLDGAAAPSAPGIWPRFRSSFAVGYWFGFGYFLAGLWWIGSALLVEADSFAWALPFAVLGMPLVLAAFYGAATSLARVLWSDGIGRVFALAAGFGAAEWLRSFLFTGFPWNAIGYAAMPAPMLMQSVGLIGLWGMSALAVFVFSAPSLLARVGGSKFGLALALLALVAHAGFGAYRLAQPAPNRIGELTVRVVQPNVDLSEKWDTAVRDRIFKTLLDLSTQEPAEGKPAPELIVWPETSVPYIFSESPNALAAIGEAMKDGQTLIAGAVREEGASASASRYYNSVVQIDQGGQIVDAVDKVHLVPFGEYIPFEDIFSRIGLTQLVAGPMNFVAGSQRHPLAVGPVAQLMPYVCYEVIFPNLMPEQGSAANALLNVTNDAWFGVTPGPYQHLRQAQVRAVETGKVVIRAANTGISAIIEPTGAISQGLALGAQGHLDATVSLLGQPQPTPLDRNLAGLLLIGFFAFAAGSARLLRQAAKK